MEESQLIVRDGETLDLRGHDGWNNILIRRDPHKKILDSGIVLPGKGQQAFHATVDGVGIGTFRGTERPLPCSVKVGDRVLVGKSGGYPIKDADGQPTDRFIIRDEPIPLPGIAPAAEILAVLEGSDA